MRKRLIAFGIVLLANVSLAWGEDAALRFEPTDESQTKVEVLENRPLPSLYRYLDKPVAASAEDAEIMEAADRKGPRLWVRAEYMIWWIKQANFPPLVTSGDFSDPIPGALNSLNTKILFGSSGMDFFDRKGGRFSAGWWLDDEQTWGVEAGYLFMGGRSINNSFVSPGNPVLATPFFNTNTGQPDSSLVTFPGILSGQVAVEAPSFLQGAEVNLSATFSKGERYRLEGLAGFRYVNLNEGLSIESTSLVTLAPQYVGLVPFDGNTITVRDTFETRNQFYGGQVGARAEMHHKRWTLDILTKIAFGVSHETVHILGFTGIDTQPTTITNAGLLAVSSNSGQFSRNSFAVVPEASINLYFQLTDHLKVFAGYTFLYWSHIARPGDQVDINVNPNLVPTSMTFGAAGGPARPAFTFHSTDFFAHGVNFGLELRY